ncbi:response regulator transcription factor [Sulfurovum sp. ST-21]|uniref:Response regulator transcription factor n=1 Tax=Sulfurovum indicum TaxID=2779528 RepID=A0A7M1S3L7_9BACT|nr:response regulator transcription factor [Sulfurovum indicum]QOR62013.1 response regulator transcription factor [Sulfurovum indicum]
MKILLLEDDLLLSEAISKFLIIKGHAVQTFKDGESVLHSLQENCFDLLILDINVPNIDGLTLLEMLQKNKIQIPTIFISAIIDIDDISRAFTLGCHDYLKKPFHLKELSIRIDKILQSDYIPHSHLRLSKNYSLDIESSTLRFKGEVQVLPARQLKILILLANNRSRVVDYALFQEYAWDNMDVEIPTIRAEVNRLKKALKEDIIINIRNMGYMIKRPV